MVAIQLDVAILLKLKEPRQLEPESFWFSSSYQHFQKSLPKCLSMDEWVKKMWHTYIYVRMLFSHQKEGNLAMCDAIDGL